MDKFDYVGKWTSNHFGRYELTHGNHWNSDRRSQKLAFLKDVYDIPRQIAHTIEEINALRNAMAHAFFPENLRAYHMKGPPAPRKPIPVLYRGNDIFSAAGARKFVEDCAQVTQFLRKKLKRRPDTSVPFLL